MKKQITRDADFLTTGPINQVIFAIATPLILNNLVRTLYNLTDGLFLAQLSSVDFAATAFVWPLNFLFIAIGMGIGVGATSLIAQYMGGQYIQRAERYASNVIVMSFGLGLIFAVLGYFMSPLFISWMGARGELFEKSVIYLKINYIGLFFDFVFFAYQAILNAQGKTQSITVISVISSLINVVLDPIFIFHTIPLVKIPGLGWGIAGAGWATVISKVVLLILAYYTTQKHSQIASRINWQWVDLKIFNHIFRKSLPISLGYGGSALGFTVLNSLIQSYGNNTLAAYSMVNRITDLLTQPQMGIGAAMTSIIGQNVGARKFDRTRRIFKRAILIILACSAIASVVTIIFRYPVLGIFIKDGADPQLWAEAVEYLYYTAFIIFFMGLFSAFNGFFQGVGQTQYSMYMSAGRLWFLRLPIIWILQATVPSLGSTIVWLAMLLSNLLICVYGFIVYLTKDWRRIVESQLTH